MSDEEVLSRLLRRGKRKNIVSAEAGGVDALVERLAKSSMTRGRPRPSSEQRSAELITGKGLSKRRRPTGN